MVFSLRTRQDIRVRRRHRLRICRAGIAIDLFAEPDAEPAHDDAREAAVVRAVPRGDG
jgi:hypothetical protein